MPSLHYRLPRDLESPQWALVVYILGIVALVAVIAANTVLTAYHVISTPTTDFNATQTLWYHRLTGCPKPRTQCSSYNISVGQQFTTTNKLLTYTLLTVDGGGMQTLPYTGIPLHGCDVVSAVVEADAVATTVIGGAHVVCDLSGLRISAKAEYVYSPLPTVRRDGHPSPAESFFSRVSGPQAFISLGLNTVCSEMGALLQGFPEESSVVPGRIFVQGFPRSCSQRSYPYRAPPDCQEDHTVPVTWLYGGDAESYFGFANGTRLPETGSELTLNTGWNWVNLGLPYDTPALNVSATYLPSVTNILQLLISAIRLDFGIVLPNNPYLNMSVMTDTLQETMPTEGMRQQLIGRLGDPENIVAFEMDSFVSGLPAYLSAEYQCRFKYQKGWIQAVLKAIGATLGLFARSWILAMHAIARFAKKRPGDSTLSGTFGPSSGIHTDKASEKTATRTLEGKGGKIKSC